MSRSSKRPRSMRLTADALRLLSSEIGQAGQSNLRLSMTSTIKTQELEIESLRKELNELTFENKNLKSNLSDIDDELKSLHADVDRLNKENKILAESENKLIKSWQNEVKISQECKEALETEFDLTRVLRGRIDDINNNNATLKRELEDMARKLQECNDINIKLNSDLEQEKSNAKRSLNYYVKQRDSFRNCLERMGVSRERLNQGIC